MVGLTHFVIGRLSNYCRYHYVIQTALELLFSWKWEVNKQKQVSIKWLGLRHNHPPALSPKCDYCDVSQHLFSFSVTGNCQFQPIRAHFFVTCPIYWPIKGEKLDNFNLIGVNHGNGDIIKNWVMSYQGT